MKAYVLVGFVLLAIMVLAIISRKQREHIFGVTTIPDINNRLGNMENKIAESDKKRSESEGEINSTRR